MLDLISQILRQGSGIIHHPDLGEVHLHVRKPAGRGVGRSIRAGWSKSIVSVSVPAGVKAKDVAEALVTLTPRLLKHKPIVEYHPGDILRFDGLNIALSSQSHLPMQMVIGYGLPDSSLSLGSHFDFGSTEGIRIISRGMQNIAFKVASRLLLPRAREIAERLGCHPSGWEISRGTHVLGQCDRRGIIKISSAVVFLPQELRDYIVCHELAHLSEMNHSSRFHAICDRYCGGRERQLIAKLRGFRWPIVR